MRRPALVAVLIFVGIIGAVSTVLFTTGAFPPGVITAEERGYHIGNTYGLPALVVAVCSWVLLRRRWR